METGKLPSVDYDGGGSYDGAAAADSTASLQGSCAAHQFAKQSWEVAVRGKEGFRRLLGTFAMNQI